MSLYSGPNLIGKVDIAGVSPSRQIQSSRLSTSFPRRSSLLPTASSNDSSFEEGVHLLSPIYPASTSVYPTQYNLRSNSNNCLSLRDVSGPRITLQYNSDTMYRITLPPLSESPLVSKCIIILRNILKKDIAMTIITKWYCIRNTRGSQDLSYENEWSIFHSHLLNSMGRTFIYNKTFSTVPNIAGPSRLSGGEEPKKRRKNDDPVGSNYDFQYLQAFLHKASLEPTDARKSNESKSRKRIDMNSVLAPYIPIIFFSFHLLYEELKLDETLKAQRTMLSELLNQLALDLQLDSYCLHYFLDCPDLVFMYGNGSIAELDKNALYDQHCLTLKIPNFYGTVNDLYSKTEEAFTPYPYIPNVNPMSKCIVDLLALITSNGLVEGTYNFNTLKPKEQPMEVNGIRLSDAEVRSKALEQILAMNITRKQIARFPPAIHFLVAEILESCRIDTPQVKDPRAYELIHRPELYSNTVCDVLKDLTTRRHTNVKIENSLTPRVQTAAETIANSSVNTDGMNHIYTKLIRLRFPKDLRIEDVRQMLASSTPVLVDILQRVGVSDHDFIEEKEKKLLAISARTMALPIGRGNYKLLQKTIYVFIFYFI